MNRYSASDIEKFSYCHLNWLLSKVDHGEDSRQAEGTRTHRSIEKDIEKISIDEEHALRYEQLIVIYSLGATLLALVGIMLYSVTVSPFLISNFFIIIALIWFLADSYLLYLSLKDQIRTGKFMIFFSFVGSIFGLSGIFIFFKYRRVLGEIIATTSILWVIAAIMVFYISTYIYIKAQNLRKTRGIVDGRIIYNDNLKDSPLLTSREYPLAGRPDYIVYNDNMYIPVELKTGRTPQGPLYSHIAQLMVYCMLVEENYRVKLDYGIIKYPEKSFPVIYTDAWKKRIVDSMKAMDEIKKNNVAHRNHNKVNKCRYCSRRNICPEKLI